MAKRKPAAKRSPASKPRAKTASKTAPKKSPASAKAPARRKPAPARKATPAKSAKPTKKAKARPAPTPKVPARERLLSQVDFLAVAQDYARRLAMHGHLVDLYRRGRAGPYAVAALGMADALANQSAREHDLGPRILRRASPQRILDLARTLAALPDGAELPAAVRAADIDWLKVSAASEMAAMLDPARFWVTNHRTVWADRLVSQGWSIAKADEELRLYRDYERDAAMEFNMWGGLHREVGPSLLVLAKKAAPHAHAKKAPAGEHPYLWAASLAAWLFEHRAALGPAAPGAEVRPTPRKR